MTPTIAAELTGALGLLPQIFEGVTSLFTMVTGNDSLNLIVFGIPVAGAIVGIGFRIAHRH